MSSPTFISKIGLHAPFLLDKGVLYQLCRPGKENKNIIDCAGVKFETKRSLSMQQMEEMYFNSNLQQLSELGKDFIKKHYSDKAQVASTSEFSNIIAGYRTVKFIVEEIFPAFIDNEDVGDILTQKTQKNLPSKDKLSINDIIASADNTYILDKIEKKEFSDFKNKLYNCIDTMKNPYSKLSTSPNLGRKSKKDVSTGTSELSEIKNLLQGFYSELNASTIGTSTDERYIENLSKSIFLSALGKFYSVDGEFKYIDEVENVDLDYRFHLEKKFLYKFVDGYDYQVSSAGSETVKATMLDKLIRDHDIVQGDIGVKLTKREGSDTERLYIFLKVPQYALKEPDYERYYLFEPCHVVMNISYSANGSFNFSNPMVMEKYVHPFLSGSVPWNGICMGGYDLPSRLNTPDKIIQYLSDARKVIMKGYIRGSNPYNSLSKFDFKQVTKEHLEQNNIPVTNIWGTK